MGKIREQIEVNEHIVCILDQFDQKFIYIGFSSVVGGKSRQIHSLTHSRSISMMLYCHGKCSATKFLHCAIDRAPNAIY